MKVRTLAEIRTAIFVRLLAGAIALAFLIGFIVMMLAVEK